MKIIPSLLVIVTTVMLTGCGVAVQLAAERKAENINAKYDQLYSQEEILNRIRKKILISPEKNRTLDQLSDDSFPTTSEKEAISVFDKIETKYENEFLLLMEKDAIKAEVSLLRDFSSSSRDNRLDLFRGLISYGQYNRNAKALRNTFDKLLSEVAQITEEQRRQAWANAFTSISATKVQRSPIKTNCNSYGKSIDCITR